MIYCKKPDKWLVIKLRSHKTFMKDFHFSKSLQVHVAFGLFFVADLANMSFKIKARC